MWGQNFLKLFAKSPIKPIQEHMGRVHDCVLQLTPFFRAVIDHDWDKAKEIQDQIVKLEEEADAILKEIRLHLPSSIFMPFSRSDLLALLTMQDKIASKAKLMSGLVLGRKMDIPANIIDKFLNFVERCVAASAQAKKAISELDELLETGFRGREVEVVEGMILELENVEHDTDTLQLEIRKALYEIEKNLPPVDVIFLYKIIDWTGELADKAQYVGHRLESLLA